MSKHKVDSKPANPIEVNISSTPNSAASQESNIWKRALPISFIIIFVAMVFMSFSYGLSGDEVDMNEYGKAILKYFSSFGSDQTVFNMPKEFNRDGVIQYYGGLFDLLCAIVNQFSPFAEYTTRHILNAMVGFLAIFFSAKIVRYILNEQAAVLAAWMMFASPFFLGHAMNNPKDIPFAATYIMAIWCIIRLFERLDKATKWDYVWAILSIGATINIRVGGILLIPYLAVYAGILFAVKNWIQKTDVKLISFVKPVLIVGVLGYLSGSLLWPYGLQSPIANPLNALQEMSNFKVSILELFEGSKIYSGELPPYYLLKSIAITSSYLVLIGTGLFIFFIWPFRNSPRFATILFVAFTAFFPLFYIIYSKANVYHSWRHILFIFPSMLVVASFGWDQLVQFFDLKKIKIAGLALFGFLLLEPLYFIANSFPNTVTYYNQLAGGTKGAYTNYEVDYYYNSLKQSTDWFRKNIAVKAKPGDTIMVVSNAVHLLRQYLGDLKNVKMDYVRHYQQNEKPWDYAIMHIALIPVQEVKKSAWLPPSTLYKANVQNCVLSAVIKRPSYDDLKGYQALKLQQIDSAVTYFNQYLKADPTNIEVLNSLSSIYLQTGKIDDAYSKLSTAYQLDSSNVETRQGFGMAALQKGDNGTAQTLFTGLIAENPDNPSPYLYLGIAQMQSNQLDQALLNLSRAAQYPDLKTMAFKYMGDVYMKQGNQQQAMNMYQQAGLVK
ncbi:MAG TPA: tetratricopeptide repeat protein [Chitinophagaceae bacterium]|nr:tetratricopeptide repeat protein [Chitinophagaceae bacterium]